MLDVNNNEEFPDTDADDNTSNQNSEDGFGDIDIDMASLSLDALTVQGEYDAVEQFVIRLYREVLGRDYDKKGLNDWVSLLRSGVCTGTNVAHGFFFSIEFIGKKVSNDVYVDTLYSALLDRGPDAAGRAHWHAQLSSGLPREDIFSGFVNSTEFTKLCGRYGITRGNYTAPSGGMARVFATRLYRTVLQREPDIAGLNNWQYALVSGSATGASVAYGFLFSPEMIKRNLDDDRYVEILYNSMLGRSSDAAGKANWLKLLRNGTSRYSVFTGFVYSNEFDRICRSYGIMRGTIPPPANLINGDTLVARVWNLMVMAHVKGISDCPEHIAGIIGNLQSEAGSTLCPFQQELGNTKAGLGLMQWSYGRRTSLENFMWTNGVSPEQFTVEMNKHLTGICTNPSLHHPPALLDRVLQIQINYMFYELSNTSERLYMSYINHPTNRVGSVGARAYAELFCVVALRPGFGVGEQNNIQDEVVQKALRASPYAGGTGNLDRISYSGLSVRRDRAAQVYQLFITNSR